jgi:hypothetical protein
MGEQGPGTGETLRPYRRLFSGGLVAAVLLTTPVFAVLYWLAIPAGIWAVVLALHLVAVGLTVWGTLQYFRTTIRLTSGGVTERGFLGRERHVPGMSVNSILLFEVYRGSSLETTPQQFVVDREGELLLRMRGQFWSAVSMRAVAEHLGAPVQRHSDPTTLGELRKSMPGLLYWFERGFKFWTNPYAADRG